MALTRLFLASATAATYWASSSGAVTVASSWFFFTWSPLSTFISRKKPATLAYSVTSKNGRASPCNVRWRMPGDCLATATRTRGPRRTSVSRSSASARAAWLRRLPKPSTPSAVTTSAASPAT